MHPLARSISSEDMLALPMHNCWNSRLRAVSRSGRVDIFFRTSHETNTMVDPLISLMSSGDWISVQHYGPTRPHE